MRITIPDTVPSAWAEGLYERAQAIDPVGFPAMTSGGRLVQLAEPNQMAVVYAPPGPLRGIVFDLFGHEAYAWTGAFRWRPWADALGIAVASVQWWDAEGPEVDHYLTPAEVHDVVGKLYTALRAEGLPAVIHGFSRGGGQVYAMSAIPGKFSRFLANEGSMIDNYPPNASIVSALKTKQPILAGRRFLVIGGDSNAQPIARSAQAVKTLGAQVELIQANKPHGWWLLQQPTADVVEPLARLLAP